MNQPTPAIVAQGSVKRLPRLALWLFCVAYVLPGFLGRGPWKREDITAFGYMAELARTGTGWWAPALGGFPPETDALLPYWLGAWAMQLAPAWLSASLAARLPFILLLLLALVATWYATYYLARSPMAQPVPFAFGGEAQPKDYARAVADGGLLAFIGSLGLAQLAHETTPALAQLCFTAWLFFAAASLPYRTLLPGVAAAIGLLGLTLSGAPSMALAFGLGAGTICLLATSNKHLSPTQHRYRGTALFALTLLAALLATQLNLWRWRIDLPQADWQEWQSLGRLFLWFTWPAWPLALWTLWRWRHQWLTARLSGLHIWLPLWFVAVATAATLSTSAADRSLLLALPALATLAAFALPTLKPSVGALIDWFTLIFFTGCALIIWVVWLSMQTGWPAQPAANVARLAPGFEHSFALLPFAIAVGASITWAWLVKWRAGRHQRALWKSLVLPAGGAALCWLLLMTLWLPLLDFARSYAPLVAQATASMPQKPVCVATLGLTRSQTAAFQFHGQLTLAPLTMNTPCPWLIVNDAALRDNVNSTQWQLRRSMGHPSDGKENMYLFARKPA